MTEEAAAPEVVELSLPSNYRDRSEADSERVCLGCGALVADEDQHNVWHVTLDTMLRLAMMSPPEAPARPGPVTAADAHAGLDLVAPAVPPPNDGKSSGHGGHSVSVGEPLEVPIRRVDPRLASG